MAQLPPKAATRSRDRVDRYREQISRDTDERSQPPLPSRVEDVLAEIRHDWPFMLDDKFQDVPLALDLLEGNGRRNPRSFHDTLNRLDNAIGVIADEHANSLNVSLRTYSNVMENINNSRNRIATMKQMLLQSKDFLQLKQTDLLGLWSRNNEHREMLRIIDMVDELSKTPPKIDALVQNKYYYAAVTKLLDALKLAECPECLRIPALGELRKALHSMKETLYEALVDEIASHIYLKAPFSEERWMTVLHKQSDNSMAIGSNSKITHAGSFSGTAHGASALGGGAGPGAMALKSGASAPGGGSGGSGPRGHRRGQSGDMRQLAASAMHKRVSSMSDEVVVLEDFDADPEMDSLSFLRVCVESLLVLGKLAEGLEVIQQRVPMELYQMVDRAVVDFEEKRGSGTLSSVQASNSWSAGSNGDVHSLRDKSKQPQLQVLREFMETLYAQLECVMEAHKLVCNLVDGMTRRQMFANFGNDESKFPIYTIQDVWVAVQAELKTLIMDYLRPSGNAASSLHLSDLMKAKKPRSSKDTTGHSELFHFVDSDVSASVTKFYNSIDINTLSQALPMQAASAHQGYGVVDQFASRNDKASHHAVVAADPENVSVIFLPTLNVMDRLEGWVTVGAAKAHDFHQFLDDFVLTYFIPQIESKVLGYVHKYISGPDGFIVDIDADINAKPLLRSATSLVSLINSLCVTIHNVPFHREEFVRMIEATLSRYVEKCFAKYRSLVSTDSMDEERASVCVSGVWADTEELIRVVEENTYFKQEPLDLERNERLNVKEIILESHLAQDRSFERMELIFDRRKLELLAYMAYSLRWFINEMRTLRTTGAKEPEALKPAASVASLMSMEKNGSIEDFGGQGAVVIGNTATLQQAEEMLHLNAEEAARMDVLLNNFEIIANICLLTLRLELRCHVMYYLDLAMREGSYFLDDDICEPDTYVLHLNDDLIIFEDIVSSCLSDRECHFVFDGISLLMTHYLIANVRYIKRLNRNGVVKMARNISALHQNLVNIDLCDDMRLTHAKGYYELFYGGAEKMVSTLEADMTAAYSHEEYANMLGYIFDVGTLADLQKHDNPSVAARAAKAEAQHKEALRRLADVMRRIEMA
ncbi:exocyst subunit [Sorochytrium milnesiophthora]